VIGSLRGTLQEVDEAADSSVDVVVDVGGVGYLVTVAPRTAVGLGPVGSDVMLAVHTHVREGAITLYGFATPAERRCFELVIGAHGIGPALALAILSVHPPDVLAKLVALDDIDALTLVPGVGKKTAARLLIELKSRLGEVGDFVGPGAAGEIGADARAPSVSSEIGHALAGLGYGADEIRATLLGLPADLSPEDLLRAALQHLARSR
jgi:holliday junction DNA helicase RuvA